MQTIERACKLLTSLSDKLTIGYQLTIVERFLSFCPFIKHNDMWRESFFWFLSVNLPL